MKNCSKTDRKSWQNREMLARMKRDFQLVKLPFLVLTIYCILAELVFHTMCPFVIVFGRPCSGCGLTRAGILVLQGRFAEATQTHVMIYFWMFLVLYAFCFRYILGKRPPLLIILIIFVSIGTMIYYVYRQRLGILPEVMYEGLLHWVKNAKLEFF